MIKVLRFESCVVKFVFLLRINNIDILMCVCIILMIEMQIKLGGKAVLRREFEEFNIINPKKGNSIICYFNNLFQGIRKFFWKCLLRNIKTGSEKWHKYQQRLSVWSSSNDDMEIRSFFYESTIENKGELYILPGTIICYPYRIKFGYNVFINRGGYITARAPITIGDNVIIGPNVVINSGMHKYQYKDVLIRNQGHKSLPICIEDDVWIGANVVIMPGITIGKGSVIGAGSIVTASIPAYSVAVGVPARVKKKRGYEDS